jgi:hypothetical protein
VLRVAPLCAVIIVVGCTIVGGPSPAPAPARDITVTGSVPNGRVEIVVKSSYEHGENVSATLRLSPTSGTLRGPLDAQVQASGFRGGAIVRHLGVAPVTANAGGSTEVGVVWDLKNDDGATVPADDYSLVLTVLDDQGRRTAMGATIVVR